MPGTQRVPRQNQVTFTLRRYRYNMPALQEAPPHNCPKCKGSIIVERDWHGTYGSCIMCGYVHEVLTSPPIDLAAEEAALPQRQRRRQPSHGKLRL